MRGAATILNNTIAFNSASANFSPAAGGLCIEGLLPGTVIQSNIIYGNSDGGLVVAPPFLGDGPWEVEIRDNIIFGNDGVDVYVDPQADTTYVGNFRVDPLFCIDDSTSLGSLCADSPAFSHPNGTIGAVSSAGCAACVLGGYFDLSSPMRSAMKQ